jgi:DNA end-binding protein Ku
MRSVWRGAIGFGAVAIGVKAYAATEEHGVTLHQIHAADGGRIRLRRVCELDGAEVPAGEVTRGYELPGGDVVPLSGEELAGLPLATASAIEVRGFAPMYQIDPVQYARSYHLEPEPAALKPYVLLAEALQQSGKVAVVQVTLSKRRESLGVLRVREGVIMLETLLWPDEIRQPDFPFLHEDVDLPQEELSAAAELIEELSGPFAPHRYTDRTRSALRDLVDAKVEGNQVVRPTESSQDAAVAGLVAALRDSARKADHPRRPRKSPGSSAKATTHAKTSPA